MRCARARKPPVAWLLRAVLILPLLLLLQEDYADGDALRLLRCSHYYHVECAPRGPPRAPRLAPSSFASNPRPLHTVWTPSHLARCIDRWLLTATRKVPACPLCNTCLDPSAAGAEGGSGGARGGGGAEWRRHEPARAWPRAWLFTLALASASVLIGIVAAILHIHRGPVTIPPHRSLEAAWGWLVGGRGWAAPSAAAWLEGDLGVWLPSIISWILF